MKTALSVVGVVVLFVGLPWAILGNDFFLYQYFAPKREAVRREVFEQTKSYTQGTIQELENLQVEYQRSTPEHRSALRGIILRRATNIDDRELPADLRAFVSTLRREP